MSGHTKRQTGYIIERVWRNTATKLDLRRSIVRVLALVAVIVTLMLAAYAYGRSESPASLSGRNQESVKLYAEALKEVEDDYVDQEAVDPKKQTYGAIQGMIDSLGDEGHTRFLTPQEVDSKPGQGPSSAAALQAALGSYKREEDILNSQSAQVRGLGGRAWFARACLVM